MASSSGSTGAVAPRVVILRVKRSRESAVGDNDDDADRVFVKCRDLKLGVEGSADGDARYRFTRVAGCGRGTGIAAEPRSADAACRGRDGSEGAAKPAEGIASALSLLAQLSLDDDHPRGVKSLPTAQEVAARSLHRSTQHRIAQRNVLRCNRVRLLRTGAGHSALCIDCVTGDEDEDPWGGPSELDGAFDVYRLDGVVGGCLDDGTDVDGDDEGLHWASPSFDDSDDEFSFEVRAAGTGDSRTYQREQHTRRDRQVRKSLHEARTMDLLGVPLPNDWLPQLVTDDDNSDTALLLLAAAIPGAPGPLVLDDSRPPGLDNYLQYDHRHDDEYDSNAEDRQDDYPDESASQSEAANDEWECEDVGDGDSEADEGGGRGRHGAPLCTAESDDDHWS